MLLLKAVEHLVLRLVLMIELISLTNLMLNVMGRTLVSMEKYLMEELQVLMGSIVAYFQLNFVIMVLVVATQESQVIEMDLHLLLLLLMELKIREIH